MIPTNLLDAAVSTGHFRAAGDDIEALVATNADVLTAADLEMVDPNKDSRDCIDCD